MENWFGPGSPHDFQLFSTSHLVMLAIAAGGLILLSVTRKRWLAKERAFQWVRWTLFSLLLLSELSYQTWASIHGIWSFSGHVPLHLCGIASITALIGLLTLHKTWIQISFFIGIVPAFLALVTPDLPHDYHHYRFWKFFIHHTAIPWACLFLAFVKPAAITFRSVFFVYSLLVAYALVIGFFINPWSGANYLYLTQTPAAATPLDFFGDGIWYYLNLGLTALFLFLGQCFLWRQLVVKPEKRLSKR
ncbi:TIGR02206 family membrane protein [Planococcus salinus]|uniref:TIGR02206 family membrane protein n=1 Tax=Planococcus salinus TaxID=1848460 RepID=A0A3M8P5X6_9BACL|nr:TIGR02206 family membrane protein [Planococcus salinus]RNF38690.1 TIGR02206 family membrane protein [Planococcus salinus]